MHRQLRSLGRSLDLHAGKVLFVGLLVVATFCVGLKSATFHTDIEQLWAQPLDTAASATASFADAFVVSSRGGGGSGSSASAASHHGGASGAGGTSANGHATPEVLSTHQMVIQTATHGEDVNVLTPSSLLEHLTLIQRASQVTVNMYDITWRLRDICQMPSVPQFEVHYIEQMFENIMPCTLVTPLDCFWEGSKLLGPDYPVTIPMGIGNSVKWTNLNPVELVATINNKNETTFDFQSLEEYFRRAGITTGYQYKPCLNPQDPDCPTTAPNFNRTKPLDVGAQLTGGCSGFAARYMHWPPDLIIGGVSRTANGTVRHARALQTVVQIMSEQELHEYWSDSYKVHQIGWSLEKSAAVLTAWQRRFAQEVKQISDAGPAEAAYQFSTFSTATLNQALKDYSGIDVVQLAVLFLVCAVYSWYAHNALGGIGIALLVALTAAGLGVCSLLGLPMNLLSIQVLPYITVGLSMRDLFLLLGVYRRHNGYVNHIGASTNRYPTFIEPAAASCHHNYTQQVLSSAVDPTSVTTRPLKPGKAHHLHHHHHHHHHNHNPASTAANNASSVHTGAHNNYSTASTARVLSPADLIQRTGPTTITGMLIQAAVCLVGAVFPVQALRVFCLQCAIVMLVHGAGLLLMLPALIAVEARCRQAAMPCCTSGSSNSSLSGGGGTGAPVVAAAAMPSGVGATATAAQVCHRGHPVLGVPCGVTSDCGAGTGAASALKRDLSELEQGIANTNPLLQQDNATSEYPCVLRRRRRQRCGRGVGDGSLRQWLLTCYVDNVIMASAPRLLAVLAYVAFAGFCLCRGLLQMEYDVRLSAFLPHSTQEYQYLEHHNRYFGFYNFYLVTSDLEYPVSQPLLHEYHHSLLGVADVLRNSDGGVDHNDFWLNSFRDYLLELQDEFDRARARNCMSGEKWYGNASEKSVLAFKLLAQTGVVEFPVDKSQIFRKRLVAANGVIDPKAFYNYLSVWTSNDEMAFASSQANFRPRPFRYESSKTEYDLKIPKSQPLTYTQMPFYLRNLTTTRRIVDALRHIHEISAAFQKRGLNNYPMGLIFSYFNQFLLLDRLLLLELGCAVGLTVVIASFLIRWTKLWCVVFTAVLGLLPLCLLHVNALTGTMAAIYFVVVLRNTMLLTYGYLSALGSRRRRVRLSLELYAAPILAGDFGLAIIAATLLRSPFEFIKCHIGVVLALALIVSTVHAFLVMPVLLVMAGPRAELECMAHMDRIATPPPSPHTAPHQYQPVHHHHYHHSGGGGGASGGVEGVVSAGIGGGHGGGVGMSANASAGSSGGGSGSGKHHSKRAAAAKVTNREPSLTTITEESCNQSIVLEPQVTVECSYPAEAEPKLADPGMDDARATTSVGGGVKAGVPAPYTTKVTATANIKVELVAPMYIHRA